MLIILSPSKTQNFDSKTHTYESSHIEFNNECKEIINTLKPLTVKELQKCMKMSDKIAIQTKKNIDAFHSARQLRLSKPALCSYTGQVFRQFPLQEYSKEDFHQAQETLIILSGLYGILRPLDLIEPYRLEMQSKIQIGAFKNLYDFWKDKITNVINKRKSQYILNLMSQEYFSVLHRQNIQAKIISPIFLSQKNNEYKIIATHAKTARGLMANWCIKNKIHNIEDIKNFTESGYRYSKEKSTATDWYFLSKSL